MYRNVHFFFNTFPYRFLLLQTSGDSVDPKESASFDKTTTYLSEMYGEKNLELLKVTDYY